MPVDRTETARKLLAKELDKLSEHERSVVDRFINRGLVARNVAHEFEEQATFGQRLADRVAAVIGSWRFIVIQSTLLAIWIVLNITAYVYRWDPYPFILLNLALSFQAAYATPFILMSQNRQSGVDREKAQQDLDCDLKAEMEIELLHDKLDSLRTQEIAELKLQLERQYEIIQRLEGLLEREISANHPETNP